MSVINGLPNSEKMLQEMLRMKNESLGAVNSSDQSEQIFGNLLQNAINKINIAQHGADEVREKFELNDPNTSVADVMLKTQKANVYFQMGMQVKNKLINAYKEIMNMPV